MTTMIVKVNKLIKALLQRVSALVSKQIQREDSQPSVLQTLVEQLLDNIDKQGQIYSQLFALDENYVCLFAQLDQDDTTQLSANNLLLNCPKMRDFEVPKHLADVWDDLILSFVGEWVITSRRSPLYGSTMVINRGSALDQAILAAVVQFLTGSIDKPLYNAEELIELDKGNGALKDYHYISGEIWAMAKVGAAATHGHAYVTRFRIDLLNGKLKTGKTHSVSLDDRTRERSLQPEIAYDREYDELER